MTTHDIPHEPIRVCPQWWTWVYLITRLGDEIIYLPYHSGLNDALREGRLFRYKEDALVYLYGEHYSTLKA